MVVTSIEPINKSRSKIFLDGEFAFVLYKGELRLYHIECGKELAESSYKEIMEQVLPKRAKLRAMNLLQSKEYTEEQLRRKLRENEYSEGLITTAVEYVKSFHYIDDSRYALYYIRDYAQSRSRMRINQDLLSKGVAKHTIQSAWEQYEEQDGGQNELQMIRRLLEKRGYSPENADASEKRKTYAFLARKGFSSSQISKAMKCTDFDYCE